MCRLHRTIPLALTLALLATPGRADDSDPRRTQAERLGAEGRCAAALELTEELRADGVVDTGLLMLDARCAVQQRRYEQAIDALREVLRREPDHDEAQLRLAIAHYHLGEFDAARAELDAAERAPGEPHAEALLYRGLLHLEDQRGREAAEALESARARDPRAVEPVASYYAALAWTRARQRARADAAIERVLRDWPDTAWAAEAERLRERLATEQLRRWVRIRGGFEYDDNAVLQGGGAPLPDEISSARDTRGTWSAEAGAELLRGERWSAGVLGGYSGSAYSDIESFDTHYPVLALWLDRQLDEATTLRLALDGGYAWVDGDPFLATGRTSLSLLRGWESAGASELYVRFRIDDYLVSGDDIPDGNGTPGEDCPDSASSIRTCGPPGVNERRERNRDGRSAVIGLRHTFALPALRSTLHAGYDFERFDARGQEYSHVAHSLSGGVLVALPFELALDVSGIVSWRPFDEPSTFPDPPDPREDIEFGVDGRDRNERYSAVSISVARPIGRGLTASAGWRWERNHSNVEVFDYRREVLGAYLTWSWGH